MEKKDRSNLGYLGQAFQIKFIGQLLTDWKYAQSVIDIVKPEYFDDEKLRCIVMLIKDNHEQYENFPDYISMEGILRKETSGHQLEHCLALLAKSKEYGFNNTLQVQETAEIFFKQQETIKVAREILKIAEEGDIKKYYLCEDLLKKALELGSNKDEVISVFDNIDAVLSKANRKPIPTDIQGLDINMGGGLGKGELGIILAALGVGKAQPLFSKILTSNGWSTMGAICYGDKVIGHDGKPCNVIGVFPQGKRPIYKVSFNDNTETLCDAEHLWYVNTLNQRHKSTKKKGKHITLPPDNTYKVMKTIDMINNVKAYGRQLNYKIPNVLPVEFNKKNLLIDPYLLGVILGDGCITIHAQPNFTTKDTEIIENVRLIYNNISVHEYKRNISKVINGIPTLIERSLLSVSLLGIKPLLEKLLLYGTNSKTKFIPNDYLYTSKNDRIRLLQGLMDTDGYINNHRCEISTVSKEMSLGIRELVLSLGGKVNITEKLGSYNKKKCSLVYRINFSLPDNGIIPVSLTRKVNNFNPRTKYGNNKFIKSIEYYGEEEAQCIMVDNPEHLYVTDDYIITHNTTMITKLANAGKNHGFNVLQIFFEDSKEDIQRKHFSCWTKIPINDLENRKDEVKANMILRQTEPGILKLKRFPSHGTTMAKIRTYIKKKISEGFRPDLILLDYIDCIEPDKRFTDHNQAEGHVMREFETMLDELQVAGWVATQGNRCVTLDTKVNTIRLGKCYIKDIIKGDEILTHLGYKEVTEIFPIEKQTVYKIRTKSGKEIKVSNRHEFPTENGLLSINSGLKVGSKLLTNLSGC